MTHLSTNRNPQSEARRQHVHGPLSTTPQSRREQWAWCALFLAITAGAIGGSLYLGELM